MFALEFRKQEEKRGRDLEFKTKVMLTTSISGCRLGEDGRNICGLFYRRRNGINQYGAAGGLSENEFSSEESSVVSGPFLEHYHHGSVFLISDIKNKSHG